MLQIIFLRKKFKLQMKILYLFIFMNLTFLCYSQTNNNFIEEFRSLKENKTLKQEKELLVRINHPDYSEKILYLFYESNQWKGKYYFYHAGDGLIVTELKFNLNKKNDLSSDLSCGDIFWNLLKSKNVFSLPNDSEIFIKEKVNNYQDLHYNKIYLYVKENSLENNLFFSNFEANVENFAQLEEFKIYEEILDLIQNEFQVNFRSAWN